MKSSDEEKGTIDKRSKTFKSDEGTVYDYILDGDKLVLISSDTAIKLTKEKQSQLNWFNPFGHYRQGSKVYDILDLCVNTVSYLLLSLSVTTTTDGNKGVFMKKLIGILSLLLAVFALAACQNQSASSQSDKASQSKSVQEDSSEEDTSSEDSEEEEADEEAGMDIEAIKQGDFSSVAGTWRDATGRTLTFDDQGLVSDTIYIKLDYAKDIEGILRVNATPKAYGPGGFMLFFAPEGTTFPRGVDNKEDASDSSKDRIVSGQQSIFSDASAFYYRVDDEDTTASSSSSDNSTKTKHKSQSVDEAIHRTDTGVTLSGGQSSSDYATKILGDKGWTVWSGTYGRTEDVPYNTLNSSDNQTIYVYQNGVIISQDNQIIYEP